jgi:hypothetical protein
LIGISKSPTGYAISLLPDFRRLIREVYINATRRMLEDSKSLMILSSVEDSTLQTIKELPSWVPDFSITTNFNFEFQTRQFFSAYGHLPRKPRLSDDIRRIGITTVEVDEVVEIGELLDEIRSNKSSLDASIYFYNYHQNMSPAKAE